MLYCSGKSDKTQGSIVIGMDNRHPWPNYSALEIEVIRQAMIKPAISMLREGR